MNKKKLTLEESLKRIKGIINYIIEERFEIDYEDRDIEPGYYEEPYDDNEDEMDDEDEEESTDEDDFADDLTMFPIPDYERVDKPEIIKTNPERDLESGLGKIPDNDRYINMSKRDFGNPDEKAYLERSKYLSNKDLHSINPEPEEPKPPQKELKFLDFNNKEDRQEIIKKIIFGGYLKPVVSPEAYKKIYEVTNYQRRYENRSWNSYEYKGKKPYEFINNLNFTDRFHMEVMYNLLKEGVYISNKWIGMSKTFQKIAEPSNIDHGYKFKVLPPFNTFFKWIRTHYDKIEDDSFKVMKKAWAKREKENERKEKRRSNNRNKPF
jgi:hypothetical protein